MSLDSHSSDTLLLTTIQQEYKILAEYKMIEPEKIRGVYVIPSYGNSLVWYGVIFVRQGYFEDGIFRFTISLPEKFPNDTALPTVTFQNEIIHPLICSETGNLDITYAFNSWRPGEDHIWQVLKYIQTVLNEPNEYIPGGDESKVYNKEALNLLLQNREEFVESAKKSVAFSKEHVYDEPPTEDPHYITFERFKEEVHGPVMEQMKQAKGLTDSSKTGSAGLSWVKMGDFQPLSIE